MSVQPNEDGKSRETGIHRRRSGRDVLGFSRRTVTCLFEKEPGVIQLTRPETMHKRRYRSLRIPRHVFQRVLARLTK